MTGSGVIRRCISNKMADYASAFALRATADEAITVTVHLIFVRCEARLPLLCCVRPGITTRAMHQGEAWTDDKCQFSALSP
jgi:hypothetical protein